MHVDYFYHLYFINIVKLPLLTLLNQVKFLQGNRKGKYVSQQKHGWPEFPNDI